MWKVLLLPALALCLCTMLENVVLQVGRCWCRSRTILLLSTPLQTQIKGLPSLEHVPEILEPEILRRLMLSEGKGDAPSEH